MNVVWRTSMAAARTTRNARHDADGEHRLREARPQDCHHGQRQDEGRHAHERIGEPAEPGVEPAAVVAGAQPEEQSDRDADADSLQRRQHRRARSEDQPTEDVAPDLVRAEQVVAARRLVRRQQIGDIGVIGREQRCEHGDDGEEGEETQGDERDWMPAEVAGDPVP
jgi:hypothetical protein